MIKLLEEGSYKLVESKGQTKILQLNGERRYAWINVAEIGEILVTTHKMQVTDCVLAAGKYRLYDVQKEQALTDLLHLELSVGNGEWQGYLLPTGLPIAEKIRSRVIPTHEIITKTTLSTQ